MRKVGLNLFLLFALLSALTYCSGESKQKGSNNNLSASRPDAQRSVDAQPPQFRIEGEYGKAFLIAYDAFKSDRDIPEGKKLLENYHIEFRQNDTAFFISFMAKPVHVGGESELGKDATYSIDKKTFTMIGRHFYK